MAGKAMESGMAFIEEYNWPKPNSFDKWSIMGYFKISIPVTPLHFPDENICERRNLEQEKEEEKTTTSQRKKVTSYVAYPCSTLQYVLN